MRFKTHNAVLPTLTVGAPTLASLYAIFQIYHDQVRPLDWWLLGVFYVITLFGVEGGMHRYFSHKAFQCGRPIQAFLAITGSMAVQGPLLFWVATHRMHHAYADEPGDPHSPFYYGERKLSGVGGFLHAHFGWLFSSHNPDWTRFAPDLIKDRTTFWYHQMYPIWVVSGLLLPAAIAWFVEPTIQSAAQGLLWGGLVRIFLVHHVVWAVNSLCHLVGGITYKAKGDARNYIWLAIPTLGGAWHNNHHAFPRTAYNSFHWWQVDLTGYIIFGLEKLGLVSDAYYPPVSSRIQKLQDDAL